MDNKRLLATFLDLVRIDSPSYHEAAAAAYCASALEACGCSVRFDDAAAVIPSDTGNLIAALPGTAPGRIVLSAHLDCVDPCVGIEPVIEEGIIRSAGQTILGSDDKVGVASIIEAVRSLAEGEHPYPEVMVVLSICEEVGVRGASALPDGLFAGELALVLDADGAPGSVIIGAPYHCTFEATFTGRAAHAGVCPQDGISAVQMAASAIARMELGRLGEHETANVGTIEGGRAINIVPDSCRLTGECRALEQKTVMDIKASMTAALRDAATEARGEVEVLWNDEYPGFLLAEDDPAVRLVCEAAESLGLPARTLISGGGSDANVLSSKGARPLALSTGMTDFHSLDESLAVADLEASCRLVLAVIHRMAG